MSTGKNFGLLPHFLRLPVWDRQTSGTLIAALALAAIAATAVTTYPTTRDAPAEAVDQTDDRAPSGRWGLNFPAGDATIERPLTGVELEPEESLAATAPIDSMVDKTSDRVLSVTSAGELADTFEQMGLDLDAIRQGRPVPRVFLSDLPNDLDSIDSVSLRKSIFLNTLLPLMLAANEEIAAERTRLLALRGRIAQGETPAPQEQAWLDELSERYEADPGDFDVLVSRVDTVPPSMALAQSAVETGWGTSSLARRGNAMFGMITSPGNGIRSSTGHEYAAYDQLIDATVAYVHNLNTHPAYIEFRRARAQQRAAGQAPDGHLLIGELHAYSELGGTYIDYVRQIIRANELQALDGSRLEGGEAEPSQVLGADASI